MRSRSSSFSISPLPPSPPRPASPTDSSSSSSSSHPGEGSKGHLGEYVYVGNQVVKCHWEGCGVQFTELQRLIDHLQVDHIGASKSVWACYWDGCGRKGLSQTSRFALITHMRSHTGEKPYTCKRPECDKSFTRSDALAKHMRLQHNVMPHRGPPAGPSEPLTKKRKRSPGDLSGSADSSAEHSASPPPDGQTPRPASRSPSPPSSPSELAGLAAHISPSGEVMGRPRALARYLIMKAKHRYILNEHRLLLDELELAKDEETRLREEKDRLLDEVLGTQFGPEGEKLTHEVVLPKDGEAPPWVNLGDRRSDIS